MIKVLIVEDERPIARAVSRLVDQHPACGVIGMETNGQAALDFLRSNPVDLVITDIQMPVMTGLELLEVIHAEFPDCLAVILSGYAQFEYARTALQYQAFDYLLKSVTRENLFRVLDRAETEWNRRRSAQLREQIDLALSGAAITDHRLVRVVLTQDSFVLPPWQCPFHSFRRDGEHIVLVEDIHWKTGMAEAYFAHCGEESKHPVYMICTSGAIALSRLNQGLRQLRDTLEQQSVLFVSQLVQRSSRPVQSPQKLKPERAAEAIRTQHRDDLEAHLRQLLTAGYSRAEIRVHLDAILSDSRIALQAPMETRSRIRTEVREILLHSSDADTCVRQLTQAFASLQTRSATKRDLQEIVDEIAHLLETNYHLSHSAESLAKQYNFVPSYLNKVFKQYKGVRPSEYLFNVRMARAKTMLETTPNALVKDVAASVGYNDPHYFSNLFKKATGLWPTEVQQK